MEFSGSLEYEVALSRYTFYRIGGPAQILATPKTLEDLEILHAFIRETQTPFFILGWGSNLLVSDSGFNGIVIRMKQLFTQIEQKEEGILRLGASVGGSSLLRKAQQQGYGGFSYLTGIPGSVGGMAFMNAGTHLGEWKDCAVRVESVNLLSEKFELKQHEVTAKSFSYRHNHFLSEGDLITHAEIRYTPSDPKIIEDEINELYQRRKETQPIDYPSCGSVFMNPKDSGLHAWQVIDRLALRGHRIGNAEFSEKHCNFIINLGDAKAAEVKALIELAKTRARNELGIILQEEVKYIE